jgi:hypothetical protein
MFIVKIVFLNNSSLLSSIDRDDGSRWNILITLNVLNVIDRKIETRGETKTKVYMHSVGRPIKPKYIEFLSLHEFQFRDQSPLIL